MSAQFSFTPTADGGGVSLIQRRTFGKRALPVEEWSNVEDRLLPAVRYLRRLADDDRATDPAASVLPLSADEIAAFPAALAALVGLPPISSLSLAIDLHGTLESPQGQLHVTWRDPAYRTVIPRIEGAIIHSAAGPARLTSGVFHLLRAIDAYNGTSGHPGDVRIAAWAPVQKLLSDLVGASVHVEQLLKSIRIYQAGAFALDIREAADGPQFDPILMASAMRRSLADDAPADPSEAGEAELPDAVRTALLPLEFERRFAESFNAAGHVPRPSYALARNTFLVVDPDLQAALQVVRRMQYAPAEERREFLRNPRTYITEALPEGGDEVGTIFVETQQYSERVIGLGLWEKPYLPWLERKGSGWLPEGFVLRLGGRALPMDEQRLAGLAATVDRAVEGQQVEFDYEGERYPVEEARRALDSLKQQFAGEPADSGHDTDSSPSRDKQVLKIKGNEEAAGFAASIQTRKQAEPALWPEEVRSEAKPHQASGFGWLVQTWKSGLPGVLLADDMGLGKTLQALAFLAWFRRNRRHGQSESHDGPIIVVAPTALLRTWRKEAERHLVSGCLGECVEVFGRELSRMKSPRGAGWTPENALDVRRLREADWILTTYETLATYHRAFARVRYSIAVFDEMQKIKAPDTINSHTAKTLNADFVIGLTGTPIENRIEDIWCVMDRVSPGLLGTLKDFSARYGKEDNEDALRELKAKLDQPQEARPGETVPPIMLRRMKSDHLKGLPEREIKIYPADMPEVQARAYEEVVGAVRKAGRSPGDMLRAIHQLRGVSLHPAGAGGIDPYDAGQRKAWIAASARVTSAMDVLGSVRRRGQKALLFIEDRAVQEVMAAVIAAEFGLPGEPEIINGAMPGDRRQAVVDRFQAKPPGFDVLILAPKAAGVGLTITAANHVVHLSRWWNPAVEDQCNDRVYRIGQELPVTVHIPIARHPHFGDASFDVKLDALLARKRALSRDMLVSPVSDGDAASLYRDTVL
ncbi:MAG: DEAD/DEAH box helicase [Devosia sp.]